MFDNELRTISDVCTGLAGIYNTCEKHCKDLQTFRSTVLSRIAEFDENIVPRRESEIKMYAAMHEQATRNMNRLRKGGKGYARSLDQQFNTRDVLTDHRWVANRDKELSEIAYTTVHGTDRAYTMINNSGKAVGMLANIYHVFEEYLRHKLPALYYVRNVFNNAQIYLDLDERLREAVFQADGALDKLESITPVGNSANALPWETKGMDSIDLLDSMNQEYKQSGPSYAVPEKHRQRALQLYNEKTSIKKR